MVKRRTVLLNLAGPVAVLVQDYYDWAVSVAKNPQWISPPLVMIRTEMFVPFIEAMLYEIFKEYHLSSYIQDEETESTKWLRELGLPQQLILKLKCEFLNNTLAIIYGALPDIYFAEIERCQYGLSTNSTLIIHLVEDPESPMHLVATPPLHLC